MLRKLLPWGAWLLVVGTMSAYLTHRLRGPDRALFLPGQTSHGHYQIEMACDLCHTPMMGVKEAACLQCHAAELKASNDSHPKSKFTDPRHAGRLDQLNAADCVTCHREHVPALTRAMGVTVPGDYCYHCHQSIGQDRPSHRDLAFQTCNTAGCHNYHDNTALYEDFLLKHAQAMPPPGTVPARITRPVGPESLAAVDHDAPGSVPLASQISVQWSVSAHARAGVQCGVCHQRSTGSEDPAPAWRDSISHTACQPCHADEVAGFLASRHGMRLAQGLTPMQPGWARQPMKAAAAHRQLTCTACHGDHEFDTRYAAVEACLDCHDDGHSLAYLDSPHALLWQREMQGAPAGSGVSCATCHLPRHFDSQAERVRVQHNQNDNLRPNEKMLRSVCLHCHELALSIDALADPALVRSNFKGRPARHIESLDWAQLRQLNNQKTKP